jgi:YebC/PmpR family DNA-binding regulatory protein
MQSFRMSGHSRWSQIKHKKAAADKKKGQLFGKLSQRISIAGRDNQDPNTNLDLRSAIENAKAAEMPLEKIERILKKAASREGTQLTELLVEAITSDAIPLLITAITDNKNRTITELRTLLTSHGARLADPGSIVWMFEKVGVIIVGKIGADTDAIILLCIDSGARDVEMTSEAIIVLTEVADLSKVKNTLQDKGLSLISAELRFIPQSPRSVSHEIERRTESLLETIEDQSDVEHAYSIVSAL